MHLHHYLCSIFSFRNAQPFPLIAVVGSTWWRLVHWCAPDQEREIRLSFKSGHPAQFKTTRGSLEGVSWIHPFLLPGVWKRHAREIYSLYLQDAFEDATNYNLISENCLCTSKNNRVSWALHHRFLSIAAGCSWKPVMQKVSTAGSRWEGWTA